MEERKKLQVFLQCNIATTSQMDWQPPITSTPVNEIRQQSYSVFRERRVGMLRMANCGRTVEHSRIPSPVMKKASESILSKSNRSKGKGILVSDSSSDEEEDYNVRDKKLVIKINSDKKNEVEKNKRKLKINNSNSNVAVNENVKPEDAIRNLRSNHDLSNVSIRDKENLFGDVKKSTEKKKVSTKNAMHKLTSQKRKCMNNNSKGKKLKIDKEIVDGLKDENAGDKSRNSLHQLFSEKREEEFLESLDLTAVDVEEPPDNSQVEVNRKKKEKKSKGRKIKPKKKEDEPEKKNEIEEKEVEVEKKEEIRNCSVLSDRPVRNRKPPKKFWLPGKNSDDGVSSSSASTPKREKKNSGEKKPNGDSGVEYFKNIKDLEYRCNSGYQSAECCSLSKFKSGVLRLEGKAYAASKTRGKNSALGGIVLEGSVKMKIGNAEKIIEQGDTIFVPSLTEWRAVNLSEKESVIYYWCGLF